MALTKITYATKTALNPQPSISAENKVTDADMNEIKTVVNNAIDQVDTNTTAISNSSTYSTSETIVGTWINGKPIYRICISKSANTGINVITTIANLDIITKCQTYLKRTGDYHNVNSWGKDNQDYGLVYVYKNEIRFDSSYSGTLTATIEYTKTTD